MGVVKVPLSSKISSDMTSIIEFSNFVVCLCIFFLCFLFVCLFACLFVCLLHLYLGCNHSQCLFWFVIELLLY